MHLVFKIAVFTIHLSSFILCDHAFPKQPVSQDVIKTATKPIMDDYLYMDKTLYIPMVSQENPKRLFFSRPRRFGKSVFLRILQAFFQNRKEIFPGTDIFHDTAIPWERYPVMYFDMSSVYSLTSAIETELVRFKKEQGIDEILEECRLKSDLGRSPPPQIVRQFREILCTPTATVKNRKVVVLVDEYDHFFLEDLNNPVALNETTRILKAWFLQFKNAAEYIELAFVTGVTRSSFLLVGTPGADFEDISRLTKYADLAGITEGELYDYFGPEIIRLAEERRVNVDEIKEELRSWYDGFRFSRGLKSVYNPLSVIARRDRVNEILLSRWKLSVINYFEEGIANNYWARANSPSGKKNLVDSVPASWKGELRSPNGTLLKTYRHEDSDFFVNWARSTTRKTTTEKTTATNENM